MFRQVSIVACVVVVVVGSVAVATTAESKEASGKAKSLPRELTVDLGKGIKLEMVLIPAGEFMMGSKESAEATAAFFNKNYGGDVVKADFFEDEHPQHRVRVTKPFYLGKYLVTQEQWQEVMGSNPSWFSPTGGGKDKVAGEDTRRFPVEKISWDDCQQFLRRLNAKLGTQDGKFVLPTETQWEYACRAGTTTRYCFGDDDSKLSDHAWNNKKTDGPVGEKKPNIWGLYDMHGNVWEWCQDWYEDGYYARSSMDDPTGPAAGSVRVIRGGSWCGPATSCRSACRLMGRPGDRSSDIGFRVSRVPAEVAEPTPATPKQITNSIGMKLTLVPSGEFLMGSKESAEATVAFFNKYYGEDFLEADDFKHEHPQHRVRITRPFYLGTYHVTLGQFRQFVAETQYRTDAEKEEEPGAWGWNSPHKEFGFHPKYSWRNPGFEQADEHPVVCVSWNDAAAFCKWLGKKDGKIYRLPTEAEWEYACRAGTTTRYSSGDDPETLAQVGNVADAAFEAKFRNTKFGIKASDGFVYTAPVGKFKPNAFGLYDMHGNAWQWCADWYAAEYYATSPADDPSGPDSGADRVLRGGSWCGRTDCARSAGRDGDDPVYRSFNSGFRVARTQ